ncbi:hypothetical protein [Paraburkholderia phenoliruptrix]|uniref:hypothetical protein n=1 Tax=Paraburkholderia phenoliruptrix TaxID=252970 RepID=UPI002869C630|nr:hypothetical protein [Paraburkholderia phenoliruptrix]WMY09422.1 hypothetical protein P3F88_06560 [Paraburkholderia phenoliruptrix]
MARQEGRGTLRGFATVGARIDSGGQVTAGAGVKYCGSAIVGAVDVVPSTVGSEAIIRACTGCAGVIGINLAASRRYPMVGSPPDNGDAVNHSPDDKPRISTVFVCVGEHGVSMGEAA